MIELSTNPRPGEQSSAEFVYFKVCGCWFSNKRQAAEFLRGETLRYSRRSGNSTLRCAHPNAMKATMITANTNTLASGPTDPPVSQVGP
jgi:hypothetical protein